MTKEITIRGVRYASQVEAARILRVAPSHVSKARKSDRLDTVGLKVAGLLNGGRPAMPVTLDGVHYPTRIAACAGTGLHYRKLVAVIEAESRCGR